MFYSVLAAEEGNLLQLKSETERDFPKTLF